MATVTLANSETKGIGVEDLKLLKKHCGVVRLMLEDDDEEDENVALPLPSVRPSEFNKAMEFFRIADTIEEYERHMDEIPKPVPSFDGNLAGLLFFKDHPEYLNFAESFRGQLFDKTARNPDYGLYQNVANYLDVPHLTKFLCFLWALAIEMRSSYKEICLWLTGSEELHMTKEEEERMQKIFAEIAQRGPFKVPPASSTVMNGGVAVTVQT